jgi:hypothetical protein
MPPEKEGEGLRRCPFKLLSINKYFALLFA